MVRLRPSLGRNPWLARLQAASHQNMVRERDEDAYVLRPGQGPLKSLGPGALYGCWEKSTSPLAVAASTIRTEGVKKAARRMRDLKLGLIISTVDEIGLKT
jgi:hypothetical protein